MKVVIDCVELIERKVSRKAMNRRVGRKRGKDKKEKRTGGGKAFITYVSSNSAYSYHWHCGLSEWAFPPQNAAISSIYFQQSRMVHSIHSIFPGN